MSKASCALLWLVLGAGCSPAVEVPSPAPVIEGQANPARCRAIGPWAVPLGVGEGQDGTPRCAVAPAQVLVTGADGTTAWVDVSPVEPAVALIR